MQTEETPFNSQWVLGGITSLVLFGIIAYVLLQVWPWEPGEQAFGAAPDVSEVVIQESVTQLGIALVSVDQYVLPFELASVLLLAALIGAIVVAWPESKE